MTRWKHATAFFNPNGIRLNWLSRPFASNPKIAFLRVAVALGGRRIEGLQAGVPVIILHIACGIVRDGFRERRTLGHLSFWGPRKYDPFDRLSQKRERMPLLCVVPPQKYIFRCTYFGSTIALDLQQKLKLFLHSSKKNSLAIFFMEFIALLFSLEVLFVTFPWFLACLLGLFFGYIHVHTVPCCRPRKYFAVDLIIICR